MSTAVKQICTKPDNKEKKHLRVRAGEKRAGPLCSAYDSHSPLLELFLPSLASSKFFG